MLFQCSLHLWHRFFYFCVSLPPEFRRSSIMPIRALKKFNYAPLPSCHEPPKSRRPAPARFWPLPIVYCLQATVLDRRCDLPGHGGEGHVHLRVSEHQQHRPDHPGKHVHHHHHHKNIPPHYHQNINNNIGQTTQVNIPHLYQNINNNNIGQTTQVTTFLIIICVTATINFFIIIIFRGNNFILKNIYRYTVYLCKTKRI